MRLSPDDHFRVRALYENIRDWIKRGELPPGARLTYAELYTWPGATHCHIASSALWLLRKDGLVETRRGLGSRVVVPGQEWSVPEEDRYLPLRLWVEKTMRQRLADGVYPPGTRIPPLEELREEFDVSKTTVRFGLSPLIRARYLLVQSFNQRRTTASSYRWTERGTIVTEAVKQVPRDELLRPDERDDLPPNGKFEAWGASNTLIAWSRHSRCKVSYHVLYTRVYRYYWPIKAAMTTPTN
ncbi:GntR family transcriptional regulator [Streptomyces sp. NPDC058256]|uniref:GntR family transcriptional regulator n=1 Tax=Streptomyces sp. NPDC058256 TaxID=3346408 RepID=UPI0036E5552D